MYRFLLSILLQLRNDNKMTWQGRVQRRWNKSFDKANVDSVIATISGKGPEGGKAEGAGAHVVVNISSAHISSFCKEGYKNAYEIFSEQSTYSLRLTDPSTGTQRIGGEPPKPISQTRKEVDRILQEATHIEPEHTYFCAVEVSGYGVRFYGDMCLVLKHSEVDADTVILDRNSYDLMRSPWKEEIAGDIEKRKEKVDSIKGYIEADLPAMAAYKVMERVGEYSRRLTTGEIAGNICVDEDYIEVLHQKKIGIESIAEVRMSEGDVVAEAHTLIRLRSGIAPDLGAWTFMQNRHRAIEVLDKHDVRVRVITASGRIKG